MLASLPNWTFALLTTLFLEMSPDLRLDLPIIPLNEFANKVELLLLDLGSR